MKWGETGFQIQQLAPLQNGLVQQADGLVRSAITDAQESTVGGLCRRCIQLGP
jgi:hypothetical protein